MSTPNDTPTPAEIQDATERLYALIDAVYQSRSYWYALSEYLYEFLLSISVWDETEGQSYDCRVPTIDLHVSEGAQVLWNLLSCTSHKWDVCWVWPDAGCYGVELRQKQALNWRVCCFFAPPDDGSFPAPPSNEEVREMRKARAEAQAPGKLHGVYLVQDNGSGDYKIGCSGDVHTRITQFKTSRGVSLIAAIQHQEYWLLEKELHERFASKRLNGEWFALGEEDVEYIKSLAVSS